MHATGMFGGVDSSGTTAAIKNAGARNGPINGMNNILLATFCCFEIFPIIFRGHIILVQPVVLVRTHLRKVTQQELLELQTLQE